MWGRGAFVCLDSVQFWARVIARLNRQANVQLAVLASDGVPQFVRFFGPRG